MGQPDEPTVDPRGLSMAQRFGEACVVCRKKWPRPRVRVGRLPDSTGVFACDECAPAPPAPRRRPRRRGEAVTSVGRPAGERPPARAAAPAGRTEGAVPTGAVPDTGWAEAAAMEGSPGRRVTRAFGGKSGTTR
ncbi:hypothetical protein [Actinomadura chibensis]|uniref:Uncharacterized protein n=1 Tax=Actinomadura chibensis TaxID=392828 RepID=A0A5D0NFZ1_9ACTN|nr:hypothetical protein [Actinomadura chibensis]TYB43376.1 hypothetical protein FXF69_26500 [Actinomadura chibensis]